MAFHPGPFDRALAAAAGDDRDLEAQLRRGFVESVERQIDLMRRARCDANWRLAAQHLHAVAAGFHAEEIMDLADEAAKGVPGDPVALRNIAERVEAIRQVPPD
ncbi:MAG: Hpt domain-containing protein [Erythrobacter sp.]|nr:Hpt domain-containing protein [Erythrobacter sp.]